MRAAELTSVGDWGRWDAAGHRTIYAASPRRYAYQEVLAYLTPAQSLHQTALSEVFDDVDEQAGSVLEAIAKEWEGKLRPTEIARQWRDERLIYELGLPPSGWFIDIGHGDSLAALNSGAGPIAGLVAPTRLLTLEDLVGTDRALTCAIATRLHQVVLDDGWQPHGVFFRSKWGTDGQCWAVWLRATDDGWPSGEPTKVVDGTQIPHPSEDPDLKAAATGLNLCLF